MPAEAITSGVRAALALILTISLPFVLWLGPNDGADLQAYQDALAAVVSFYFGASDTSRDNAGGG